MSDETRPKRVRAVAPPREEAPPEPPSVEPREPQPAATEPEPPRPPAGRLVRCPVCEGSGEEVPGEGEERLCRCAGCQVLFRNPRLSIGKLRELRQARFAGSFSRPQAEAMRRDRLLALEVMRGYHALMAGKPAPLNAFGKKVLEIGCGLGFRLREFEKYGWTVLGSEPAAEAVAYARATALEVLGADLDAVPRGRGPFHLVLLHDVLSEAADPRQLAADIMETLAPRGVVCATAPVNESGEPLMPEGAVWGFTEEALRRLFMERGAAEPEVSRVEGRLAVWFQMKSEAR